MCPLRRPPGDSDVLFFCITILFLIFILYWFIAVAKKWKQPKCLSTDEWIKSVWYIYTMQFYSAIEKAERMPCEATWMDLEIIILSEVSQTETDSYHMISLM